MILFFAFGFIAFMGLYETTPMQLIESQITGRAPASVAASVAMKSTEVLKIDCANFNQEVKIPAHQVRLEGYLCDKLPNQKEISIRNETTGKTATLFNKGKSEYMTDFIQLKDGKNQITLSYVSKNQQVKKVDLTILK
ncbi:MAG: hypothetical protein V4596_05375 [Bdellovibrionota bacterium]